jgi:hypothetical protein
MGLSGKYHNTKNPQKTDIIPYDRNSHCHDFKGPVVILVKAYASRPPKICWKPFIMNQYYMDLI